MTASVRSSTIHRVHRVRLALATLALAAGCATPGAPPVGSPLELLSTRAAFVPDGFDLAARDAAAAALVSGRTALQETAAGLAALDRERIASGQPPSGLAPRVQQLVAASLDDPFAYRDAARALLERDDVEPALRAELEQDVGDDPLQLARARLREERVRSLGRVFNTLAAGAARTLTSGLLAGVGMLRSSVGLAVAEHLEDELPLRERQALSQWKRFLDGHPEDPRAALLLERVEDAQARWNRTQRDRYTRLSRRSAEEQRPDLALVFADRALHFAPEDEEATRLRDKAWERLQRQRAQAQQSLEAPPPDGLRVAASPERALALALLEPGAGLEAPARALLEADPHGPLADEARFALALALEEGRDEDGARRALERLARADDARSNMARHARALVRSPSQNAYGAFVEARARDRSLRTRWVLLGPLAQGARDRELPRPVEWLIELPSLVDVFASLPTRLVRYPWLRPWPFGAATSVHARTYLARQPEGVHADEVRGWLQAHEERRGNWYGAWRVAQERSDADPARVAALREKAAGQALEAARGDALRDARAALLRRVAHEFQGTRAGDEAGHLARAERERSTPQRIRISRGFLLENPRVAGPDGLGLRPELLDDEPSNGELHREGVTLLGGRIVEFAFLGASGRYSDEPDRVRREISEERLARLVALLDEVSLRNALVDPDDLRAPDADRDRYFERARLGVSDTPDARSSAESTYAFIGMRERYGLVRGRESILPFDLVVQGSLTDLGVAAFPRIRTPRPTADAILYR